MTSEAGLIAAAHASYVGSFRTLATHLAAGRVRSAQPVFAFVTGIPLALLNGCVVAAPATPQDLRTTTWAAVQAGRAWGCAPIVLQASELGRSVYERMGFRTVVRYQVWTSERD